MARYTMENVRFYLDQANATLEALGLRGKKLATYQAYSGKRLVWSLDHGAMDDRCSVARCTTGELYEIAYAVASVLNSVAWAQSQTAPFDYELMPMHDARKSFYGKAVVSVHGLTKTLYSYGTRVMVFRDGTLYRTKEAPQSATTARHMNEFAQQLGYAPMSKAELQSLPTI